MIEGMVKPLAPARHGLVRLGKVWIGKARHGKRTLVSTGVFFMSIHHPNARLCKDLPS